MSAVREDFSENIYTIALLFRNRALFGSDCGSAIMMLGDVLLKQILGEESMRLGE
jgi:hypothetical protein